MNPGHRKAVIVTGATGGIGSAIAERAAKRGHAVVVHYRTAADAAKELCDRIIKGGGRALSVQADLGQSSEVERMLVRCVEHFGNPGILINNAGITGTKSPLRSVSDETLRQVFDTNLLGCALCYREAIPYMSRRDGNDGGVIINISSAAASLGSAGTYIWYAASKSAIETLTLGLSRELAADGIRVNAVSPGVIDTDIHRKSGMETELVGLITTIPMNRLGTAAEIADAVLWLSSDEATYCTGTILRVAGGR